MIRPLTDKVVVSTKSISVKARAACALIGILGSVLLIKFGMAWFYNPHSKFWQPATKLSRWVYSDKVIFITITAGLVLWIIARKRRGRVKVVICVDCQHENSASNSYCEGCGGGLEFQD